MAKQPALNCRILGVVRSLLHQLRLLSAYFTSSHKAPVLLQYRDYELAMQRMCIQDAHHHNGFGQEMHSPDQALKALQSFITDLAVTRQV